MATLRDIRIMLLTSAAAIGVRKSVLQNHITGEREIVKYYSIAVDTRA